MERRIWRISLYARLVDGRKLPWHRLGVVVGSGVTELIGRPVRFNPQAAHLAPLWDAAEPGLRSGKFVVEFGVFVDGHIRSIGSTRVNAELGRKVRDPAAPCRRLPGGPRPIRSRWPSA